MDNKIGNILRNKRIEAGFSVKDISARLTARGYKASEKTIYSWENGNSQPTPDALLEMCDAYGIKNILESFGFNGYKEDGTLQLNIKEQNIIEKYRLLDSVGQETIAYLLEREVARTKQIQQQQAQLNDLAARPITVQKSNGTPLRLYTYMQKIASAGTGFLFDDIPSDTIEAPYVSGADFIIGVNGDSMEPDYHDGDKLYIQKTEKLLEGDIGIFTIGNECFVKELGSDGLISRNAKYQKIPGSSEIRLIGKVISKLR